MGEWNSGCQAQPRAVWGDGASSVCVTVDGPGSHSKKNKLLYGERVGVEEIPHITGGLS